MMNEKIWKLVDDKFGKTYRSIPTDVPPTEWKREGRPTGELWYASGPYRIERRAYGLSAWTYVVFRDGEGLFGLHPRLKDAKLFAMKNAAGQDTVHVA